jgi:hypothetical protein
VEIYRGLLKGDHHGSPPFGYLQAEAVHKRSEEGLEEGLEVGQVKADRTTT